jgi:hypothetical protein
MTTGYWALSIAAGLVVVATAGFLRLQFDRKPPRTTLPLACASTCAAIASLVFAMRAGL